MKLPIAMVALFAEVIASVAGMSPSSSQPLVQSWPQSTVRLILPLPPGTGTDIAARFLAERLSQRWGQPVIVENRQGADGIPAVTSFLTARDPHQLLFSFAGVITINPLTHSQLPYDPKDLVPIAPVIDNYMAVSVSATVHAETLSDVINFAKRHPGRVHWASTPGLPQYLMLALQRSADIDIVRVPYREFGPAIQDLTQGRLQVAATAMALLLPHHASGRARLLFVTGRERSPQAPDVPTAAEAGYPNLTFEGVVGIYGWRGMPMEIQDRISKDVQAVTTDPAFRARLAGVGSVPHTGSGAEFAAAIEQQRATIASLQHAIDASAQ